MSWRTVVISNTAKLDYQMGYMVVRKNELTKIHLSEIEMLIIESTSVSLTAALLSELTKKKIKVIFCDEKRNPSSELIGYYGSHDTSSKVRKQIAWTEDVIVTNPLIVNSEDRRIMNQLYKNLSDHVAKEHFEKFAEVNQHIIGFVDYVINTSEYNLVTDTDFVVANLLKYCNVHISTEYENFAEKFIDCLRAVKTICKLDVVFVINLKQYFNENYLFEIYKFCFYNKIFLVNVENIKSEAIEGDKYVIIDKALCLLEL